MKVNPKLARPARSTFRRRDRQMRVLVEALERRSLFAAGLDVSFGNAGLADLIRSAGGDSYVVAQTIQPDGKVLVLTSSGNSSQLSVSRFGTDGKLDASFGTGGVTTLTGQIDTPTSGGATLHTFTSYSSIQIDHSGRIVLAGSEWSWQEYSSYGNGEGGEINVAYVPYIAPSADVIVTRLTASGGIDSSFGQAGTATVDLGENDSLMSAAIGPDDKVVLLTNNAPPSYICYDVTADFQSQGTYSITRLDVAGAPDTSFGTNGTVAAHLATGNVSLAQVLVTPDGAIVVTGSLTKYDYSDTEYLPIDYIPPVVIDDPIAGFPVEDNGADGQTDDPATDDGSTDEEVTDDSGGDGWTIEDSVDANDESWAEALDAKSAVTQLDGSSKVATYASSADGLVASDYYIPWRMQVTISSATLAIKFNADGTPDTAFGANGIATGEMVSGYSASSTYTLDSEGRLLIATRGTSDKDYNGLYLSRLTTDGRPDDSFATTFTDFSNTTIIGTVTLTTDLAGNVYVAAATNRPGSTIARLSVARITPVGGLDETFSPGGVFSYIDSRDWYAGLSGTSMLVIGDSVSLAYQSSSYSYDDGQYRNDTRSAHITLSALPSQDDGSTDAEVSPIADIHLFPIYYTMRGDIVGQVTDIRADPATSETAASSTEGDSDPSGDLSTTDVIPDNKVPIAATPVSAPFSAAPVSEKLFDAQSSVLGEDEPLLSFQ